MTVYFDSPGQPHPLWAHDRIDLFAWRRELRPASLTCMHALLGDEVRDVLDVDDPLASIPAEHLATQAELDRAPLDRCAGGIVIRVPLQPHRGIRNGIAERGRRRE